MCKCEDDVIRFEHVTCLRTCTNMFTQKRFYTQILLHTNALTHRRFYPQSFLQWDVFTDRQCCTHKLPHKRFCTNDFTHNRFYFTYKDFDKQWHTYVFRDKRFCAQTCLHRDVFVRINVHTHFFNTKTFSHTNVFTHARFCIHVATRWCFFACLKYYDFFVIAVMTSRGFEEWRRSHIQFSTRKTIEHACICPRRWEETRTGPLVSPAWSNKNN